MLLLNQVEEVDQEWLELILMARELGLTPCEIRKFLSRELDESMPEY